MPARKPSPAPRSPASPSRSRARIAERSGKPQVRAARPVKAPPAPNEDREEAVRRRIIRAAADVYRESGYERASMIGIARRLGMTAPALYWYFKSKEDILVAFLEHTIADLIRFVRSLVHSRDPRQRLREFVHAYVLWQLQQQELSAAYERIYALGHLRNSLPERQRQRIKTLEREFYSLCQELVTRSMGRRQGSRDTAAVSFALIGMVEHLIAWFRPNGSLSVHQLATLYADLALAMVDAGRAKPALQVR